MENCLEAKNVVDSVIISKQQIWGLSQDVLYCFTDTMNDYAMPNNASFLKFSEKYQESLRSQDVYSWNDVTKVLATPIIHRSMDCNSIYV